MTTDTRQETLRECIERGGRGEFAKALLAFCDSPCDETYVCVQCADPDNLFFDVFLTAIRSGARDYLRAATEHFPALAHLDEPAINWPDLRGEE